MDNKYKIKKMLFNSMILIFDKVKNNSYMDIIVII